MPVPSAAHTRDFDEPLGLGLISLACLCLRTPAGRLAPPSLAFESLREHVRDPHSPAPFAITVAMLQPPWDPRVREPTFAATD